MENMNMNGENASDDENENIEENDEDGCIRIDDIYIAPPPKHYSNEERSGPRLILHKIVNVNFKSYAGEKVVGPFHQRFSAIVGPNGSGKSNVIDSMLFVFGYRANKIRSKKVSFLIHNSKEHPNVTSCKVAVHFKSIIDKEGDDYEVVPNSEFVISRTAFKDNTNHYELNGRRVQFKQIAQLLRSYGVDLDHNRFLILQGEVEQIALMKPKGQQEGDTGMLEFLEDIIGTTRFKEPLEKLQGKVELLTETRVEKLNRLRVAEKEKKELEEPMQEAVEYLRMENSIMHLQHQIYQLKKHETLKSINEEEEKHKEMENDLTNLKTEMKQVIDEREEKQKIMKEKSDKWKTVQNDKDNKSKELANLQNKDEALHAEMVEANKMRKNCKASAATGKTKLEQLKLMPNKHEENIRECEALVEKNMKKREKEEAVLAQLMGESEEITRPLIVKRSELETKLIGQKKQVNEAQSKYALAKKKLDIYTSNEQNEQTKLEDMKQSYETDTKTLKESEVQRATLTSKIGPTEKSLKGAKKDLAELEAKEKTLQEQLNSKRAKYDEQKCAMSSSRSRNKVINALMDQKRSGNFPGIYGRLGDLGAIDAKYDVAISTACGALENIVVDTVDTAQKCIAYLRQNNIGRASFIPLEKQQRFKDHCKQRIRTPENVSRLFDLIKVENPDVLVAFYYALQDTLVADNLDQATRIAYGAQRFRVVTLKGELIEMSGTMSGGGRVPLRGRMGQSVVRSEPSAVDLERLSAELDSVYEELQRCKAAQPPIQQQIDALTKSYQQMQRDLSKYDIDIRAINERLPLLRQQLKQQEIRAKESASDPKQVKKMQAEVESLAKDLENAEEASNSVEVQVKSINDEIDKVSGGKMKQVQKQINDLSKSIEKAKAEITKARGGIKSAERDIKNCEQQIEHDLNEVKRNEDRLREINDQRKEIENVARNLTELISQLEEQLEERDQMLGGLRDELAASQTRESKMKHLKVELDHKFAEKTKLLKELKHKIPELERRMASTKLHVIPNTEVEELRLLSEEEMESLTDKILIAKLQRAKERMPEEVPNLQLIREYQEKDELYLKRAEELDAITTERNKVRNSYDMVKRKRSSEFLCGFEVITRKLKEMYQMITLGGDAELELVDSIDPFSEGVVFSVRPPKKSWKNINNLSGGEKTLSSLALVFALHHYRPTPLYFMDEIDAALDFKNVSIVGHYINERTKNAQFIVISLRSNMFELADYMVGIYKTHNATKAVCLDLSRFYTNNGLQPPSQDLCTQNNPTNHWANNNHEVTTTGSVASSQVDEQRQNDVGSQSSQQEQNSDEHANLSQKSSQNKRASIKSSSPDSSQNESSASDSGSVVQKRRSKRRRKN